MLVIRLFRSAILTFAAVTFVVLLVLVYAKFTVPTYGYMGYEWDPDFFTIATGVILVGVAAWFLPTVLERATDIFLHILFCFAFAPALVMPSAYSPLTRSDILIFQMVLLGCFLFLLLVNRLPTLRVDFALFSVRGYEYLLIAMTVVMFLPLIAYLGVPVALPGFNDVYAVRLENRAAIAASPFFVGYVYGFMGQVLAPILYIYGFTMRRPRLVVAGLLVTLYLYGINGGKSDIFTILLLVILYVGIKYFRQWLLTLVLPAAVGLVIVARLVDQVAPNSWFTALMVNRTFILPGVLTGYYHEFFTENGFARWGNTFLSWASDYPYPSTPAFMIGRSYFSNPDTRANANFWADGVANFGMGGMVFVTLVVAVIIWVLNSIASGRDFSFVTSLATVSMMTIASASVFTSILTHGIALTVVLIALSPATQSIDEVGMHRSAFHILYGRNRRGYNSN